MMQASLDPSMQLNGQSDIKTSCVYFLNLPTAIDENVLTQICSRYGEVQSCRVVANDCTASTGVGFVNFQTASVARDTVRALHGAETETGLLDVQAGPPIASRQAPCDNLYVRNMPASWTEQELHDLFKPYGTVQECRILHRGDDVRGAGALVRMNSVANASLAILGLNGHLPVSGLKDFTSLPLLVRFADSPEEKARKQARKEQMAQQTRPMDFSMTGARLTGRSLDLPTTAQMERYAASQQQLQAASLPALSSRNLENSGSMDMNCNLHISPRLSRLESIIADTPKYDIEALLSSIALNSSTNMEINPSNPPNMSLEALNSLLYGPKTLAPASRPATAPSMMVPTCTSLYVKNLPPEADRLWMYERFAPHGSILSVKVLQEENSNRCRGVGFVNFAEAAGALKAINNVNGMKIADKHLHVSLQANRGCF